MVVVVSAAVKNGGGERRTVAHTFPCAAIQMTCSVLTAFLSVYLKHRRNCKLIPGALRRGPRFVVMFSTCVCWCACGVVRLEESQPGRDPSNSLLLRPTPSHPDDMVEFVELLLANKAGQSRTLHTYVCVCVCVCVCVSVCVCVCLCV